MTSPSVRRRALGAALATAAVLAPSLAAQEQPTRPDLPPHFAITDARIVTGTGQTLERGTVVVRDGVITAVGSNVGVPADAWRVDGAGLTVYPGLIDAMTTLGHPAARDEDRRSGGDDVEHSWGPEDRPGTFTWTSAADGLDESDPRIERWRNAGFTTALSTLERGFLPGQAALVNLAGDRGRSMVVANNLAQRINLSAPGFPGYPGNILGSFAYIKQLYMDADHYDAVWSAYEANPRGRTRPEYDQALEPLRNPRPVLFPAEDDVEFGRAIETASEMGARPIVYGARRGYEAPGLLASAGVPALVNLDWPDAPRDADPEAVPELDELRFRDRAPTTPAELDRAGVRFAFTTGSLSDPADARAAVRRAIDMGLSRDAAVRALTLSPAEIFGVADRLGSIETGKIANLTVTDGDLFEDGTEVRMVFIDGRRFENVPSERMARGGNGDDEDGSDAPSGPPVPMAETDGPYRDDAVTLIRNATVMTASRGTLANTDVLLRDGKIAAVGQGLSAPSGATVVDATGMYVTPGIIDAHTHIAADGINEGTVNVSAMVGMEDVVDPEDPNIYWALAGGVTSANLLHGSANPIGGRNAVLKLRWGSSADEMLFEGAPPGIKFALGENTKRDREPDRYPATRMGVQDVIRQAFLDAQQYMREWQTYEARVAGGDGTAVQPRRDLELETLAEILRGERLVHAHSYRADEILQLIRLAEEFDFQIATFQHVLEGYKVADEMAAHGAGASTFSDWWAYKVEAYDAIPYNAALMTERGVTVSINSDSGEEMRHLNQEAAKAIKWGGLSEEEALKLVTLNPAIQLGVEDQVGSIDVGKDADVVIFQGHPLTTEGVVQKTYVDGKLYFDIELDRERQEALEAEKRALLEKHHQGTGARVVTDGAGVAMEEGR
ncbi:MAG: amidohydrolase family protein [Gemmatimonadetes bacterium]|nr:amidohydrolase family protein [Gemmatimonadota bacterium]